MMTLPGCDDVSTVFSASEQLTAISQHPCSFRYQLFASGHWFCLLLDRPLLFNDRHCLGPHVLVSVFRQRNQEAFRSARPIFLTRCDGTGALLRKDVSEDNEKAAMGEVL